MQEEKMSFSKKYFHYLIVVEFMIILFIGVIVLLTGDVTPISWAISAIGAEITVYSGFYLWKAKNENRSKYTQMYLEKMADQYGIDMALRVAEMVLKE